MYVYIYVTLRNAISPYGEGHTVVLYARATRAAIARPRDCTFFHNYSTFFHNSTTKWTIRLPISLSMHRPHQRYCDWCCSKNQGFGAGEEAQTAWTWRETPLLLGKNIIPRCIYSPLQIEQTDFHTFEFVKGLTKDCLQQQKLKNRLWFLIQCYDLQKLKNRLWFLIRCQDISCLWLLLFPGHC